MTTSGTHAESLEQLIYRMFDLVDEQFANAMNALREGDTSLAQEIRERDDAIDVLEKQIDEKCEELLALGLRSRNELRRIIVAIKINTDLERIGDHAKNIAKSTVELAAFRSLVPMEHFDDMIDHVRAKLYAVLDAFQKADAGLARRILQGPRTVHKLHGKTLDIAVERLTHDGDHARPLYHIMSVSKALERVSDHVENIAESVIFWLKGVDVRHRRAREAKH